jgi:hypothetical protein
MSLFKTILPVDIGRVLSALPEHFFLHSITFNKNTSEVTVEWEHAKLESGLTVPVNFPLSDLTKKLLPAGVRDLDKVTKQKPKPKVDTAPAPKPTPPPAIPLIRTQAEFDDALSKGENLEYQGLKPIWKLVEHDHVFTAGYFYRKAVDGKAKSV